MEINRTDGPDKVFSLSTPEQMLRKLHWEITNFGRAIDVEGTTVESLNAPAYWAFNCAVTAWHIADWVWLTVPEPQRDQLFPGCHTGRKDTLTAFQVSLQAASPPVLICRHVATASKHMEMTRHVDPSITVDTVWTKQAARFGATRFGDPFATYTSVLTVSHEGTDRPAIEIFKEAFGFWQSFLEGHGLAEPSSPPGW